MKSGSRPVFEKKIVDFFAFLLSNYFYLNVIFSGFLPESHKGAAVGGDDANHWRLCQGGGPAGATLHHASCLKFLAKTKYHAFWPRPVLLLVLGDWCEQFHSDEDMFFKQH